MDDKIDTTNKAKADSEPCLSVCLSVFHGHLLRYGFGRQNVGRVLISVEEVF